MSDGLAAVILAAGLGTRLRPLTLLRPKALCPVANVALVDHALGRARSVGGVGGVAVNIHHHRDALDAHLDPSVHRSFEDEPLGTAGALGQLRAWLDGRDALVLNADAWCPGSLADFVDGWDGDRVRLLIPGGDELTPRSAIAGALMPWPEIAELEPEPAGLYEVSWREAADEDRLEVVRHDGPFVDCGTPAQYLAANLAASGGQNVIGEGAQVLGTVERCVLWPGAVVHEQEHLVDAIRADHGVTVLVRRPGWSRSASARQ